MVQCEACQEGRDQTAKALYVRWLLPHPTILCGYHKWVSGGIVSPAPSCSSNCYLWTVKIDNLQLAIVGLQHSQREELVVRSMRAKGEVVNMDGIVIVDEHLGVGTGERLCQRSLAVDFHERVVGQVEVG